MKAQGHICPLDSRAVTCTGEDDSVVLTGSCPECGTTYEVTQYTPVPFKGDVDPHSPLLSAPIKGPGGVSHPVVGTDKDSILRGNELYQEKYKQEIEATQKQIDERKAKDDAAAKEQAENQTPKESSFVAGGSQGAVDDKPYSGFGKFSSQPPDAPPKMGTDIQPTPPGGASGASTLGNEPTKTNTVDGADSTTPNPFASEQPVSGSENNPGSTGASY